jgi:protein-tyrosine phosphatase
VIDLHCHPLPGLDDGAENLAISLTMARAAVAQGVTVVACTPHILPGAYYNHGPEIRTATKELQNALDREGIPLKLVTGADVHMAPNLWLGCARASSSALPIRSSSRRTTCRRRSWNSFSSI